MTAVRTREARPVPRPLLRRRYPLVEVPDAPRYLDSGRASGKVAITVCSND